MNRYSHSPLLSVLLPVHNAARYLPAALASLAAQTLTDFEIIAVDDGSTDTSPALLRAYGAHDLRLNIISQENTGIVGALNAGLGLARGYFIARMDADDIALPNRFATQLAYLREHPHCVAVGTDVLYVDPEGAPLVRHRPALDHATIIAQLLEGNGGALVHPSVLFRRDAIEQAGGYRARYNWVEDLDLYLRLAAIGSLANLPDVFLHYRQHSKSVNSTQGNRETLRHEIVNPHRHAAGLSTLVTKPSSVAIPQNQADWRRHWAYDATRGGENSSARKNAWRACFAAPLDLRNWRCLRYTFASTS
ncbi:glycosyltransferase family 2 protein [Oleiharenicola lentus]|uniref:glycosyltransferase family 2 protein n=1 Tax=Oleiharenicola lentus TaxID=2508720 RepID=UPI003F67AD53